MFNRKTIARVGIPLLACSIFFGIQSWLLAKENGESNQVFVADGAKDSNPVVQLAQAQHPQVHPNVLYQRAWRLIRENFYQQDFNHQDWNRWKDHYNGKLKTSDDSHKAIETMLASLNDPYTRFLDREAFDEERDQIEAHLFGVGMQLGMNKESRVIVIAPIPDTPAANSGVMPGWEIIEVDDKPVKGQSLEEVVKQIRGEINTNVYLTFQTKPTEKKRIKLTRAEIPIRAVANCEILPGNIGYIRLDSFISAKANQEMRDALEKTANCDGLILDLRNNPGGLLTNAVDIANMFLNRGIIVSTIDADGYKNSTFSMNRPICKAPMVVLINKGSASASEILSGALRDNGRAKLVGEKSFGKGLVQAINRLDDGSGINITIAKYLTPNDVDINKSGIVPDFKVDVKTKEIEAGNGPWWFDMNFQKFDKSPTDGKDLQLNKAIEVIKSEVATRHTAKRTANTTPTMLEK